MLANKVPWKLTEVAAVYLLRLVIGLLLVRIVYPMFFQATPFVIEMTDRMLVLTLVGLVVAKHRSNLPQVGLNTGQLFKKVTAGLGAGLLLMGVSIFSERIYTTVLLITPTQHPLVVEVQAAETWRELLAPLFLAGLMAPVTEEVLYRMFTFLPLKDRFGLWGGALLSSAIFALLHFNAYWLAEMIVVGTGLAFLYYYTGSLISSIVAHSFINSAKIIMLFLGLPL